MKQLRIKVIKLVELNEELKSSIYCEISFKEQKFKTKPVKNRLIWDTTFELGNYRSSKDAIMIQISTRREILGEVTILLSDYRKDGTNEKQYEIPKKDSNINIFGSIVLEITISSSSSLSNLLSFAEKVRSPITTRSKSKETLIESNNNNNNNNNVTEDASQKRRKRDKSTIPHSYSTVGFEVEKEKKKKKEKEEKKSNKERERKGRKKKNVKKKEDQQKPRQKRKHLRSQSFDHAAQNEDGIDFLEVMKQKVQQKKDQTAMPSDRSIKENNNNNVVKLATPASDNNDNPNKLFGKSLAEIMERQKESHPDLKVPAFFVDVAQIINTAQSSGANIKGIFRIRGKLSDINIIRAKIDNGEYFREDGAKNIHAISFLMKAFLRELPVPILPFELYDQYMSCADIPDMEDKITAIKAIIDSIPEQNYHLLHFVFELMHQLSLITEETQMNSENLAKVLSPNLLWKEVVSLDDFSQVDDAIKGNMIVNIMIVNYHKIFTK